MKIRCVKQYFNMVEVALAMAIIAIGISSILVLFPVGVNAGRSAIANNNIVDIMEYLTGYVQYQIHDDLYNGQGIAGGLLGSIGSTKNTGDSPTSWTAVTGFDNLSRNGSIFRYEQKSTVGGEDVVDFAAEIRMWSDNVDTYYRNWAAANVPWASGSVAATDNYERLVYMEVSWPADVPYANREKKVYLMDFFNPNRTERGEGVF